MIRVLRAVLLPLAAPLLVAALWQVTSMLADSTAVPGPGQSLSALVDLLGSSRFRANLMDTVLMLCWAFAVAAVLGVCLGALVGGSDRLRTLFGPMLHLLNATPKIVFFPVFILSLGLGDAAIASFAIFHGVFVAAIVLMEATEHLDPRYRKVIAAYRLGAVRALLRVVLPALLPFVVTALRLCLSFTFIGLILAELLTGTGGLGGEILRLMRLAQVSQIAGIVLLVVAVAVVPILALRAVEVRVQRRYLPGVEVRR